MNNKLIYYISQLHVVIGQFFAVDLLYEPALCAWAISEEGKTSFVNYSMDLELG